MSDHASAPWNAPVSRGASPTSCVQQIWGDLVFGARTQLKTPASSVALVLTLALGIAAASVSFTVTNGLFLNPLPVDRPAQLVRIYAASTAAGSEYLPTSFPDFLDIRDERSVFSGVVAEQPVPYNLGVSGRSERIFGELVAGGYFSVLGVRPAAGRLFSEDEEHVRVGEAVAVLSYGLWQRRFGGDMATTPEKILLNGHPVRVIGVAPEHFHGTLPVVPDVWVPAARGDQLYPTTNWLDNRGGRWFYLTGRLQTGVTIAQARAALAVFSERLRQEYPATNRGVTFAVLSEAESRIHPMFRRQIFGASAAAFAVALLVLVVACTNVAGVLLVRANARRKEIGVRLAIGATRARLVRQLLTEHILLSLVAGAIGLLATYVAVDALSAIRVPGTPIGAEIFVDTRVLSFCVLLAVGTGIAFGLAPALDGTRLDPLTIMRDGTSGEAPRRSRTRATLMVAQVSVSMLLLIACGLFFRSLQNAERIDLGFEPEGLVMTSFDLGLQNYSAARVKTFELRLSDRLAALPNVTSAGLASHVPFEVRNGVASLAPDGYTPPADGSWPVMPYAVAGLGYFSTMKIPLLEGREFNARDVEGAPPVVIVNDVIARRFWPGRRAVGQRVTDRAGHLFEVVGVAKGGKYLTLGEDPKPYVYFAFRQWDNRDITIVARGSGDSKALLQQLGDIVHALDPDVPVYNVKMFSEHLAVAMAPAIGGAASLTVVGIVALILTSLGLYGAVAQTAGGRTYEIGVRRALGAEDADVVWLVVREAATLVVLGLGCGVGAALLATRLLSGLLYDVDSLDPMAFALAPAVLVLVCVVAAWIPTRRAIRVGPATALRHQ